ncbi:MAG TPA: TIGR04283 family arsenosugar biosynthesis glycosyltransferase [Usitatibacteraceae bacterium]
MRLSIIIPTLNEAANIEATLRPLQAMRARAVEIIVVDGGSSDATRELAMPLVDRVMQSAAGRATQMNAGANVATGDILLFLHADSLLSNHPNGADDLIAAALATPQAQWGRFDVNISGSHFMFPIIAWFMNQRSRLTGIATGDQGIFVRRIAFTRLGGFPDQPLMEDIEFSQRMGKLCLPVFIAARLGTSGRRWEKHGVWRTIGLMWRLRWRYWRGVSAAEIHRAYHGR